MFPWRTAIGRGIVFLNQSLNEKPMTLYFLRRGWINEIPEYFVYFVEV